MMMQDRAIHPVLASALYYVEHLGFGLCSIPPGTKGPNTPGWNAPALYIDTKEKVTTEFNRNRNNGCGLIHAASNTCSLDIDNHEWATIMLAEFGIDLDAILASGMQITSGRENRAKAIFRLPAKLRNATLHKINWPDPETGQLVTVIEFRAGNVQDVLPPSIHKDTGQPYRWIKEPTEFDEVPELPDCIAQIWLNWDKLSRQLKAACPWDNVKHDPTPPPIKRDIIDSRSESVIQAFNDAHDLVAMLESYGYKRKSKRRLLAPNSTTKLPGVILLDEQHFFSHHASDIFGDGKRHDAFDVFVIYECSHNFTAGVAKAASLLGIVQAPTIPQVDASLMLANAAKQRKQSEQARQLVSHIVGDEKEQQSVPSELLTPPGILADIANQITTTARMPQPIFAVNAALSLVATMLARKVQTETGLRTNLYLVSLGPTGCGKEHPRNYIKSALNFFGLSGQLAGEDIASGQGLMARAGLSPDAIFQIDEFGDFLAAATEKNSASFKVAILTNFMKLFSSAGSVVTGAEYANQKMNERQIIEYPCINLHGTGTDQIFFDSLKGRHILDGYLNRLLVVKTDTPRPARQRVMPFTEPSQSFVDWWAAFGDWLKTAGGNLTGVNPASPVVVHMTPEAWALFDELENRVNENLERTRGTGLDSLHVRTWEHAAKLALVCGCAQATPVIDETAASWAIQYVEYWNAMLEQEAASRIADSEFGSQMNLVLSQIIKAGADGLPHGKIFNHKKLREVMPMHREQLLMALLENGEIFTRPFKPETGRPSTRYVAGQFFVQEDAQDNAQEVAA